VRARIAVVVVIALALIAPPALGAQMTAGEKPVVKGPLDTDQSLHKCKSEPERFQGVVIANFKLCSTYYLFDSTQETDSERDYGAVWVQGTVDPVNGWCARWVRMDLPIDEGRAHTKAPRPGTVLKPRKAKRVKTRLEVDAQGHAVDEGVLKNSFRLYRRQLRTTFLEKSRTLRMRWTGNKSNKLAFAMGVETSWPRGGDVPFPVPEISAGLQKNSC
jgi:hypothetical protein